MAKGTRRSKRSKEEIEAERQAAHGMGNESGLTHEQAVQGANLASGVTVEPDEPIDPAGEPLVASNAEDRPNPDAYAAKHTEDRADFESASEGEPEELGDGEPPVEVEGEEARPNSVVAEKFKLKYIENAKALGVPGKAAKRSNWDWLSQQIASFCLDDKHKIRIADFVAILDANGVDHSKWTNRNKGWEGRFRMTGRVALQKVVANANVLKMPDASELVPPTEFVARYKTKSE